MSHNLYTYEREEDFFQASHAAFYAGARTVLSPGVFLAAHDTHFPIAIDGRYDVTDSEKRM